MVNKRLVIPIAAVVVAAAAGGGAYAATQAGGDDNHEKAILDDAAARLHVTPQQLTSAFKQAAIDQIDDAVKAGKLTQAQANRLKQRIEQAPGVPFAGRGFGHFGMHRHFLLGGAAAYLGLTQDQLRQQLASGKSLAQVAQARGKSVTGLEQAITADVKSRLDQAVSAGRITKAEEQQRLSQLSQALPQLVNHAPPQGPPPGPPGFRGPADAGPPGSGGDAPPLPPAA